jgi:hypothetical protein
MRLKVKDILPGDMILGIYELTTDRFAQWAFICLVIKSRAGKEMIRHVHVLTNTGRIIGNAMPEDHECEVHRC